MMVHENKKQWSNDLEVAQTAHRKLLEKHKALREQYEKMHQRILTCVYLCISHCSREESIRLP